MKNRGAYTILYLNLILYSLALAGAAGAGFFLLKITFASQAAEETLIDNLPPKISEVMIESTTATSTLITWKTDEDADSLVNFGLDTNYGIARDPHPDKKTHKILLENLAQDTAYYFRLTSSDAQGNQGISSDFTFMTAKDNVERPNLGEEQQKLDETKINEARKENHPTSDEQEKGDKKGEGSLDETNNAGPAETGVELAQKAGQFISQVESEQDLQEIKELVKARAEEIIKPPTIILDYADVEVGADYAIIKWATDKESSSMVHIAREADYRVGAENPYIFKAGDPDQMTLEHRVEVRGLNPATVYHFKVVSKSDADLTGESSDKTFRTKSILPEVFNVQVTKIQEDSATLRWTTNVPCSAIVHYTNLNNNDTRMDGNSNFVTTHSVQLKNLIFDTYYSALITVESEDGEKAEGTPVTFITTRDKQAPEISKVATESTVYPGSENKIQTILSWRTDEAAKCQLFYHQGMIVADKATELSKEEDYALKHVAVVTNFIPASVYKYWITCEDDAKNVRKSEDFTMLTPSQEESIIDIIIKNFKQQFSWLNKKQ